MLKKILLSSIALSFFAIGMLNYIDSVSIFLSHIGAAKLPIVMVIVSVLVILNSLINAAFSNRILPDKVFGGVLFFFFAGFFTLNFLDPHGVAHAYFYLIISLLMFSLQEILLINFCNAFLTPLQAKNHLPLIYSFISAGVILGSIFAEPYAKLQAQTGTGWIPMISITVILILGGITARIFRQDMLANANLDSSTGLLKTIGQSVGFMYQKGRLFIYLALAIFLFVGVDICIDFKLKNSLSIKFGQETLTQIIGMVFLFRSGISWLISAFFSRRLLFKIGVGNLLIIYPISILAVLVFAMVASMNFISIIALFFVHSASYFAYFSICTGQVMSIVPIDKRQSVFFLLRGFLFAFAMLSFSALMLIFSWNITLEPVLNTAIILLLGILLLFTLLKVRKLYYEEIKENLYKADPYLRNRSIELLAEQVSKNAGEIHLRRLLWMENIDQEAKSRILISLGIIGNHQTLVDLAQMLISPAINPRLKAETVQTINMIVKKGKDLNKYPVSKHFLLKAYEEVLLSDNPIYVKMEVLSSLKYFDLDDVIQFLEDNLHAKNLLLKTNAIKTLASFGDRGIIPYVEPFLHDRNWSVVGTSVAALWQFVEMRIKLMPVIGNILVQKSETAIINALYLVGMIQATWEKDYTLRHLQHKNQHIRLYALITLIQLGETGRIDELVNNMLYLSKDGNRKELEFILSRYRHFTDGTKRLIIRKMQMAAESDARYYYDAFHNSDYVFKWEEGELGTFDVMGTSKVMR